MKDRMFHALSVLVLITLLVSGPAAAQQLTEDDGPRPILPRGYSGAQSGGSNLIGSGLEHPKYNWDINSEEDLGDQALQPGAPLIETGTPGLTFSHVQTFGVSEEAFLEDTSHFHYPYGVFASGSTVWIADSDEMRALKFNSSGVYQNMTIGKAGFREYYEDDDISLEWITDVAVDDDDAVYLVDGGASYVAKFDSSGNYEMSFGECWGEDFDQPWGIAFDSASNVFISDRYNHRIRIYDNTGEPLADFGTEGSGDLNFDQPTHIAYKSNLLYVADRNNHRVQILNAADPTNITYVATLGTGSSGSSNGQFNRPQGVAVTALYIFVADLNNDRIQVFNNTPPYSYVTKFGGYGTDHGKFNWPTDVAVDTAGNIYVADTNNQRVEKFSSGYTHNLTFGTTGIPYLTDDYHYNNPSGVALAIDGSIYISEGRGRRIVKLAGDGTPLWTFGEPGMWGDDNAHFGWPNAVAAGPDGRVFVVDLDNNRVQVLSSGGSYQATIGGYGDGNGEFDWPTGVAVDKNGYIYVTDDSNCRFQIFNSSLQYVNKLGSCGSGPYQFNNPADIAVDSLGRIYVVDQYNHRVQLYNSNRNYLRSIGTGISGRSYEQLSNPSAVAVDGKDRVYIADSWGNYIKVYDKDGKFLDCIENGWGSFQGMFRQIRGIAVDAQGNLYLADEINNDLKKYIPGAYPGWRQVNVTGFGRNYNWGVWSMTEFGGTLFASTASWYGYGAELFKLENGSWAQAMSAGFGDFANIAIDTFETFNSKLYAGTWNETSEGGTNGGQVWRSATPETGGWEKVVDGGFGSTNNSEVMSLKTFGSYLYAGTYVYDDSIHGAKIYRSDSGDSGDWDVVFDDTTPGYSTPPGIFVMEVFDGYLYAGLFEL